MEHKTNQEIDLKQMRWICPYLAYDVKRGRAKEIKLRGGGRSEIRLNLLHSGKLLQQYCIFVTIV